MHRLFGALALSAALFTVGGAAMATPVGGSTEYAAYLSSSQEVGSGSTSSGVGIGNFTLSADGTSLAYNITVGGLVDANNAPDLLRGAQFRQGAAGSNGAVVKTFFAAGGGVAPIDAGGANHTFSGTWTAADAAPFTSQIASQLKAGNLYVNVNTTAFGGGALRGQITAVPEPGSIALLASGLLPLAGMALRRRR